MDAAEEKDIFLQQASSDLLSQYKTSLPKFLWSSIPPVSNRPKQQNHVRGRVRTQSTVELVNHVSFYAYIWMNWGEPLLTQTSASWSLFKNGHSYSIPN